METTPTTSSIVLSLKCTHCGVVFEAVDWPILRCPGCWQMGGVDRVGRHFLPSGWTCVSCGESNSGTTNFCLVCGNGLSSRCVRCEGPVYSSVCNRCGAHQERAQRYMRAEARRAEWVPILKDYVRPAEKGQAQGPAATPMVQGWRSIETGQDASQAASLVRRPRTEWRIRGGLILVTGGTGLLLLTNQSYVVGQLASLGLTPDRIRLVGQAAQGWLETNFGLFRNLAPEDQAYALLFAGGLLMLASLPVLLLLLGRLAKRLFP